MKVFLDVGSHTGETLDEVIKERHNFDKVHAFEPSTVCYGILQKYKSETVAIHKFGLSSGSGYVNLYDTGTLCASIFPDKVDLIDRNSFEKIELVEAAKWITENTSADDTIYLKLNCEGSECDIIENLLKRGVYDRIAHIMIDFDVRKVPSQTHRQFEILNLLKGKTNFHICETVMIGHTHQDRINNWLSCCN